MYLAKCIQAAAGVSLLLGSTGFGQMTQINNFALNTAAGEIVSYDSASQSLLVTRSSGVFAGVDMYDFSNPAGISATGASPVASADFSLTFGGDIMNMGSLTSVAADPLNRGFAVAAMFPKVTSNASFSNADYSTPGKIGFFRISDGALLASYDVGYHTDSVTFSQDGSKVFVANEAEYVGTSTAVGNQRNGSISMIDLVGVTSRNFDTSLASLSNAAITTTDFSSVPTDGHRFVTLNGAGGSETKLQAWEPEYMTVRDQKVYVTLQENNAVGVYDIPSACWEIVYAMGTRELNGSDVINNGTVELENTPFRGAAMPDAISSFVINGKTYLVTANEGDSRGADDADRATIASLRNTEDGAVGKLDPAVSSALDIKYNGTRISIIDGDTDGDGDIDQPTLFGARGFSIIDASTGALVFDAAGMMEAYVAANDIAAFDDVRSRDKGPEPEGLITAVIDGKTYLFISTERHNGVFMFDLSDPANPQLVDYKHITDNTAPVNPEGMIFIPAADNGSGQNLLVVGYEGNDRVGVFTVVPEPAHYALMAGAGLIIIVLLRRRTQHLR